MLVGPAGPRGPAGPVTTVVDVLPAQLLATRAISRIARRIAITRMIWRR